MNVSPSCSAAVGTPLYATRQKLAPVPDEGSAGVDEKFVQASFPALVATAAGGADGPCSVAFSKTVGSFA